MKRITQPTDSYAQPARGEGRFLSLAAHFLFAALYVLIFAAQGRAEPLSAYHERVRSAISYVDLVENPVQSWNIDKAGRLVLTAEGAIDEVLKTLPQDVTVEWSGGLLHADNRWLIEAFDTYRSMPEGDTRRAQWLARIRERLHALDARLTEIEAEAGKALNKEEEKARLAAIMRREEYNAQAAEGNALSNIWKRIKEWLRKLFPEREPTEGARRENPAVNVLALIIVALLSLLIIAYAAWRLLPRFLRRDLKKSKTEKRGARVVLGEHLAADETSADLLMEADQLARQGDVRGAIRKGYIALLCELHDRKLLRLEQHKTNRDYLRALETRPSLHEEMKPMTLSFEDHWYGFIPATETDWQDFRAHYRKAVTSD